jgi:hypothetical protein
LGEAMVKARMKIAMNKVPEIDYVLYGDSKNSAKRLLERIRDEPVDE